MRKMPAIILSAIAATAFIAPPATAAPQDSVTGAGKINFDIGTGQLVVNGHGTPTDAHGRMKIRIPDSIFADIDAEVTCVNVEGNLATVSGRLINPDPSAGFQYVLFTVLDNGAPGQGTPDLADGFLSPTDPGCAHFVATGPVEQGNFTVKDR
jgi:hypothetical protein